MTEPLALHEPPAKPYRVEFCGHCFGDWLPNGAMLIADPAQDIG